MPQPLGVVGIISPWNYPLQLTLAPAVGAIAAGNRVMIKPSELVPRFSALLKEVIAQKFDADELVVTGVEEEIARAFAALPFDHLVFTGSTRVGRAVAEAAGRNLTPVTLELGGKSPAIVDRSADLDQASRAHRLWQIAQCRPDLHRARLRAGAGGPCRRLRRQARRPDAADVRHRSREQGLHLDHLRPALCAAGRPGGGRRGQGRKDHPGGKIR